MASVELDRPRFNLAADPAQTLPVLLTDARQFTDDLQGEVRRYAGGRLRLVTRPGAAQGVTVPLLTDPAGLATLQDWKGQVVLYRDGLGSRLWCTWLRVPWQPSRNGQDRLVTLSLLEVTYSEAV